MSIPTTFLAACKFELQSNNLRSSNPPHALVPCLIDPDTRRRDQEDRAIQAPCTHWRRQRTRVIMCRLPGMHASRHLLGDLETPESFGVDVPSSLHAELCCTPSPGCDILREVRHYEDNWLWKFHKRLGGIAARPSAIVLASLTLFVIFSSPPYIVYQCHAPKPDWTKARIR
jgi:hypothetical protein